MSYIQVENLSLIRGDKPVLHQIQFDMTQGETLAIIGPSGSGKSSLLRCFNRLDEPQSGRICLDGVDIQHLPVTALRRRVGMIFQKTASLPGTVADNITMGPALDGQTLSRERIRELMALASLEADLIDKDASALSGGQEQRMAIARALANEPTVLLLDEPTSALDPIATHRVEETLQRLKKELGLTMLWVSHSVEQARRISDRVLLLDAGRVLRVDSADAMFDPIHGDPRALAFASGLAHNNSWQEQR